MRWFWVEMLALRLQPRWRGTTKSTKSWVLPAEGRQRQACLMQSCPNYSWPRHLRAPRWQKGAELLSQNQTCLSGAAQEVFGWVGHTWHMGHTVHSSRVGQKQANLWLFLQNPHKNFLLLIFRITVTDNISWSLANFLLFFYLEKRKIWLKKHREEEK